MKQKILFLSAILLSIISAFLLFSCDSDAIFYDIEQETPLDDPIVTGNVFYMVPLNGKLYVQNGKIFKKGFKENRNWQQISKPDGSFIALASNEDTLYALNTKKELWGCNPSNLNWKKIADNVQALFDNGRYNDDDGTTAGRNAYYRKDSAVKKLSGLTEGSAVEEAADCYNGSSSICAAVYSSTLNKDLFSSTPSFVITKLTTGESVKEFVYAAPRFVKTNSSVTNGSRTSAYADVSALDTWKDAGSVDSSEYITCLAMKGTSTILAGTTNGFEVMYISESGVPGNGNEPTGNEESSFGTREVCGLWVYCGVIYSAVADESTSTYSKLWASYNDGSTWNCE